jgi:hypothetical protein
MEKRVIGTAGVDSGLLFLTDPCYIKHHKELHDSDKWDKFCEQLPDDKRGNVCSGVVIQTEHGDGGYPVIGHYKDGELKKIEVKF